MYCRGAAAVQGWMQGYVVKGNRSWGGGSKGGSTLQLVWCPAVAVVAGPPGIYHIANIRTRRTGEIILYSL